MSHSERTKAGIAVARAAGIRWGRHGAVLAKRNKIAAQVFAENLRPLLLGLMLSARNAKGRCLSVLAEKLNDLRVPTPRGSKWHPATVRKLMKRLEPGLSQEFKKANNARGEKLLKERLDAEIAECRRHTDEGM